MKQVVQDVSNGRTETKELPDPVAGPHEIVVENTHSLISQGTERYVVSLARKSLIGKARSRPDHVRRVLQKLKSEGLISTTQQVLAKLNEPMALGYSTAGVVRSTGIGVDSVRPGERVVTAGSHASVVAVGELLCSPIPDNVDSSQASFAGVAAIALQGIRLANVQLGSSVLVVGLGLVGQLTVALLKSAGCRVFGTDLEVEKLEMARRLGADAAELGQPMEQILAFSGGGGVDATLVTAASTSSAPMAFAAEATRLRGSVICVGLVGLDLPRPPFFEKELRFAVSGSFGPGRGSRHYEELAHDYPPGIERWTAQRNMAAFLDTLAAGTDISSLITRQIDVEDAGAQYDEIVNGDAKGFGYVIEYQREHAQTPTSKIVFDSSPVNSKVGVGVIGCGNFSRLMLLPCLKKILRGSDGLRGICSARGLNATHSGAQFGFDFACSDDQDIFADNDCHAVFISTRHNLHARQTCEALRAGKHVYVEKPLALSGSELRTIAKELKSSKETRMLMPGFNRRFTDASSSMQNLFSGVEPITIQYRFAAGPIPDDSWLYDLEVGGGRIVSEACHPIDWCIFMTGSPVVRVQTESISAKRRQAHIEGRASITLRHKNGSMSIIVYESSGSRAMPSERIEVFGGNQSATLEDWQDMRIYKGSKSSKKRFRSGLGHQESFAAFLDAAKNPSMNPEEWPIPLSQAVNGAWTTLAAAQSLHEGAPIELEIDSSFTTADASD